MAHIGKLTAGLLITFLAVACGGSTDDDEVQGQVGAATSSSLRAVDITVSAKKTGENYEARAYPIDDVDGDGKTELYNAPVYFIYVDGTDANGNHVRKEWRAPRYMPYNNPAGAAHDNDYHTTGFITAGLTAVSRFAVSTYKPDYEVHNTFSPFGGAIVVQGSFYIHAGPEKVDDFGWGSAGCVEVIGNFDDFKKDVLTLAGSSAANGDAAALHKGIGALVSARKLFVTYESATRPNLKAALSRQADLESEDTASDSEPTTDVTDPG